MRRSRIFVLIILLLSCLLSSIGSCLAVTTDNGYSGNPDNGDIYVGYGHASKSDIEEMFYFESAWNSSGFAKNGLSFDGLRRNASVAFVFFDELTKFDQASNRSTYTAPGRSDAKLILDKLAVGYGFDDFYNGVAIEDENGSIVGREPGGYHDKKCGNRLPYSLIVAYKLYEVSSNRVVYPIGGGKSANRSIYCWTFNPSLAQRTGNSILICGLKYNVEYRLEYYFLLNDSDGNSASIPGFTTTHFSTTFVIDGTGAEEGSLEICRIIIGGDNTIRDEAFSSSRTILSQESTEAARQITDVTVENIDPIKFIEGQRQKVITDVKNNRNAAEIASWFKLMRMITIALSVFGLMIALLKCALPGYQGPFLLRFKAAVAGWIFVLICVGMGGTILSLFFSIAFGF